MTLTHLHACQHESYEKHEKRTLSQLMSVRMLQPPAPTKEADAAVPRADTLSTVPTLTRVQAASVDVITFCMICSTSQAVATRVRD